MAISVTESETNAPSASAPPPPMAPSGRAMAAPSIKDIFGQFMSPSTLSNAAKDYVARIQAELTKLDLPIKHRFLNDPVLDVVAFYSEATQQNVFLTFQETYSTNGSYVIPPTEGVHSLSKMLNSHGGILLDNLVVTPNDYSHDAKMAAHLARIFVAQTNDMAKGMTINSFASTQYSISTNITQVRDYLTALNPQASLPRTDIGLVLYMAAPRPANDIGRQQNEREWIPILGVGGYTRLVNIANGQYASPTHQTQNHVPLVTITSIASNMLTDGMITLALPLAADALIRREGWLAPYTKFGKDDPNIGALILTDDDKPFFIESRSQLEQFRHTYLLPPFLAVDVTDGRARIPGIENFVYDQEAIVSRIGTFLNLPANVVRDFRLVVSSSKEFIGLIHGDVDSRVVDYLMLVSKGVTDVSKIAKFLHLPNDPSVRPDQVRELYDDYVATFTNVNVVLDAAFVSAIASEVGVVLQQIKWDAHGQFVDNNVSGLLGNQGNNYQGFHPIGNQGFPGWVPGGNPFGGHR